MDVVNLMTDLDKKLERIKNNPHCQNCGDVNPEILDYSDGDTKGHTQCCNESLCVGEKKFKFGNDKHKVDACCWAMAEIKFKQEGIEISDLDQITRFSDQVEY